MPIQGPLLPDQWGAVAEDAQLERFEQDFASNNALPRIIAEIGVVLAVPLAGALMVGWVLQTLHVY